MLDDEKTYDNPLTDWVRRATAAGAEGFQLHVRLGESSQILDEYAANEPNVAHRMFADATTNAEGFADIMSTFYAQAINAGGVRGGIRTFAVTRSPSLNVPDRYDPSDKATIRMLLEHVDQSHRVLTQVVPAALSSMSQMVNQLADTHSEAIQAIRETRASAADAERRMLSEAAREQRIDRMLDTVVTMLPAVLSKNEADG